MLNTKRVVVLSIALFFSGSVFAAAQAANAQPSQMTVSAKMAKIAKKEVAKIKVDLNTADVKTLKAIKGINRRMAAAIVRYRNKHGEFKSVAELKRVKAKGVRFSKRLIKKLKRHLSV